jgi:hypothetical protein
MTWQRPHERSGWLPLLLIPVSLLTAPMAALPLRTYYFRDFVLTYYPLRHFLVTELRAGRWPFWNPHLNEGCAVLPMLYPFELLQALVPGPSFASWLLTLHLPIAALGAYLLSRELGTCRCGAFVSGAAYSMGGLALSSLSLHWFLQALALAPLVAFTLRRAAVRGGRWVPGASACLALAVSTLAVEFVAQGWLLGAMLGLLAAPHARGLGRLALATSLGIGLAGLPVALTLGIASESLRGAGFAASVGQNAGHPVTFLQLLIPDLYGSVSEPLRFWWGGRLFPDGSPYFMSLYLGPLVLALAVAGATATAGRERAALVIIGALGLWYALGPPFGLAPLLAPLVPWFRYPVKAFLLTHAAVALLAGMGTARLREGRGVKPLLTALGMAAAAATILWLVTVFLRTAVEQWLDISPAAALAMHRILTRECATAVGFVLAAGLTVMAARRGTLTVSRALSIGLALTVADLWHGGVGLNRTTTPSFFRPLAGLAPHLLPPEGGRLFSFGADRVPALAPLLRERPPDVERIAFELSRQVLIPFTNLLDLAPVAEGPDRLSFIPQPPLIAPWERHPAALDRLLPRLRSVGVSRLLSLDALEHAEVEPRAVVPTEIAGISVHVYDLKRPWPRAYVACRVLAREGPVAAGSSTRANDFDPVHDVALEEPGEASCTTGRVEERKRATDEVRYSVESDGQGYLVVRDNHTRSWRASLDGRPVELLRANGRHLALRVPAGRHDVRLWYVPPGLVWGSALTAASLALTLALLSRVRPF